MKTFLKTTIGIWLFIGTFNTFAISYTSSGAGPLNWNDNTSWIPNGIPTGSDDVTIAAGHTIVSNTSTVCRHLVVNGTLNLSASTLIVKGDYTLAGTETGSARILFSSTATMNLIVTGTSSTSSKYSFANSVIISANSVITKSTGGDINLALNKTMTNLGTCTFSGFIGKAGSIFINGTNASLTLQRTGFMTDGTFDASAIGNTVRLNYATGSIPVTASGYYNLALMATSTGTKTLSQNTIVANNLTVNTNNTLNSNNFDLTIGGNWVNNGTFTASTGRSVTFNGAAAQTYTTVGATTFTNLTINNTSTGLTLSGGTTYTLSEVLTVSNGTFNTAGRPFTMTSTATQTARIAPISGTGAIAGNFTIERFITARDTSWADFSSPVQNSTFLDWDNELPAVFYGSFPTQYTYDEAIDDYSPVTSSGTALTPGLGFEVFLANDFNYADFTATTINTIGVPNQGNQNLSGLVSFNGAGSNLVGNPFASSISWAAVLAASSGLYDYFEMYDYTIGDYNGFDSGSGVEIGATQGFWVYADGGALSLNIPESAKTTSSNSSIRSASRPLSYFTLKMAGNNVSHTLKITSSDQASDGWDAKDIPFRRSPNKATPVFASIADGKKQTINAFNASNTAYSMPLVTEVTISGNYTIEAAGFDFLSDYTCITLEDRLLNKKIDLMAENVYSFKMNSSDKNDRFVVHFTKEGDCKSSVAAVNVLNTEFSEQVEVLPTAEGNQINFNLSELTSARIYVSNVIGQDLIEPISIVAQSQSLNISLPSDYSGMYLIKIESQKGIVTKKYVRK